MGEDHPTGLHAFINDNGDWLLAVLGILSACVGGIFTYFLKSRCSHIRLCWGFLDCSRVPIQLDSSQVQVIANQN